MNEPPAGTGSAADRADARVAIERAIRAFVAAYNAGDAASVVDCYDPALVKLRAGAPAELRGDVERRLRQNLEDFVGHLGVAVDEVVVSGDLAFTRGTLKITLTPRAGGAVQEISRRYLEIWRLTGGRWRVLRTMDNEGKAGV